MGFKSAVFIKDIALPIFIEKLVFHFETWVLWYFECVKWSLVCQAWWDKTFWLCATSVILGPPMKSQQ